uniref:Uncharacterized protein n=1 Tax=Anguilla anguilla TaxID=7936 RepID=A0A0E9P8Q7_ANGAN
MNEVRRLMTLFLSRHVCTSGLG